MTHVMKLKYCSISRKIGQLRSILFLRGKDTLSQVHLFSDRKTLPFTRKGSRASAHIPGVAFVVLIGRVEDLSLARPGAGYAMSGIESHHNDHIQNSDEDNISL